MTMANKTNEELSEAETTRLNAIARRHGFTLDAVLVLYRSLVSGGGKQAQFNHPDLGGMGQWSNGMTMIGDFSNTDLKQRVQSACAELAESVAGADEPAGREFQPLGDFTEKANWWPASLGHAASTGAQNDSHYAYFPSTRRLAIKKNGTVTIYDTADHEIFGAAQQQGNANSISFESQHGPVDVSQLKVVQ